MNRPINAPCWVVFRWWEGDRVEGFEPVRRYIDSPHTLRLLIDDIVIEDLYQWSLNRVEPFLNVIDATACSLLIDGHVLCFEPGEEFATGDLWPLGRNDAWRHSSQEGRYYGPR